MLLFPKPDLHNTFGSFSILRHSSWVNLIKPLLKIHENNVAMEKNIDGLKIDLIFFVLNIFSFDFGVKCDPGHVLMRSTPLAFAL